jgi:hypothetical protein
VSNAGIWQSLKPHLANFFKTGANIEIPWAAFAVCQARAARLMGCLCRVPATGHMADGLPLPCASNGPHDENLAAKLPCAVDRKRRSDLLRCSGDITLPQSINEKSLQKMLLPTLC